MENPVVMTIVALVVSFLLFSTFLYLFKPSLVMFKDQTGKSVIKWSVLTTVSTGLSSAVAIGFLFFHTNKRQISGNMFVDSKIRFVPSE